MATVGLGFSTVTVKPQVEPSAAVHVTTVVPVGKAEPEGGEHVTAIGPQSSEAVVV
jgi:hypothetical protein